MHLFNFSSHHVDAGTFNPSQIRPKSNTVDIWWPLVHAQSNWHMFFISALLKLYLDIIKIHLYAENKANLRGSKVMAWRERKTDGTDRQTNLRDLLLLIHQSNLGQRWFRKNQHSTTKWGSWASNLPSNAKLAQTFEFSRNTQSWQCWHFCITWILKIWQIEKFTTSIKIQSTMANVNLLSNLLGS